MEKSIRKNKGLLKNPVKIHPGQKLLQIIIYSVGTAFANNFFSILFLSIPLIVLFLFYRKIKVFLLIIPFLIFAGISYYFFSRTTIFIINSFKIILPLLYTVMLLSKGKYQMIKFISVIFNKLKMKNFSDILEQTIEYIKKIRKDREEESYTNFDIPQILFLLFVVLLQSGLILK